MNSNLTPGQQAFINNLYDDEAVDLFAKDLKAKLALAREKKGKTGWQDPQWTHDEINQALSQHMSKGDPLDVAAYAMFLHLRKQATAEDALVAYWRNAYETLVPKYDKVVLKEIAERKRADLWEHAFNALASSVDEAKLRVMAPASAPDLASTPAPLTTDQVWRSNPIMAANADLGLHIAPLVRLVVAVQEELAKKEK